MKIFITTFCCFCMLVLKVHCFEKKIVAVPHWFQSCIPGTELGYEMIGQTTKDGELSGSVAFGYYIPKGDYKRKDEGLLDRKRCDLKLVHRVFYSGELFRWYYCREKKSIVVHKKTNKKSIIAVLYMPPLDKNRTELLKNRNIRP